MDTSEKVFADGLSFFPPREGAPDFVVGRLSVNPAKFIKFMQDNVNLVSDNGFLRLDIKKSRSKDTCYVEVDTYGLQKGAQAETKEVKPIAYPEGYPSPAVEGIDPNDIPF